MNSIFASEIRLYLANGQRHRYFQEGVSLVANIFDDSDVDIFTRSSLIYNGERNVTEYAGQDVVGLSVFARWPNEYFFARERSLGVIVKDIGIESGTVGRSNEAESKLVLKPKDVSRIEKRSPRINSEIEFVSGVRLFLEFTQMVEQGISEPTVLNYIFSHPSLCCRRLGGGLSIWNTAHIISWEHGPQIAKPSWVDSPRSNCSVDQ